MNKLNPFFQKLLNSNSRSARAGREVIWSFLFQSIGILVSLLYVPLLLDYLTKEEYGIWLTLISIIGWFSFFDIGLGNGLRNKLAEALALGDQEKGRKYVSTTYAILIMIFIGLLAIFFIINPFLEWNKILNSNSIDGGYMRLVASVVFTFFILRFIVQLISVIYLADQRPSINSGINALSGLFSLIGIFILIHTTESGNLLTTGSIVTAMPVLLFLILSGFAFGGKYRHLRPSFNAIDLAMKNELMTLGGRFFLMQITAVILYSTSSFFISQFYGPEEVVVYNLVFKYYQIPLMIYTIILSPLWSSVTNAYISNDFDWLKTNMSRLNYISLFFILATLCMIFLAPLVFKLWVGDKIIIPLQLNIVMAAYTIMNIFIAPYSYFINGTGKLKLTTLLSIGGILIYFFCVYLFGHQFTDCTGMILAIMAPYFIFTVAQPLQSKKILQKRAVGIWNE
jgi:O-antigen/teichoic acid export membrane protein